MSTSNTPSSATLLVRQLFFDGLGLGLLVTILISWFKTPHESQVVELTNYLFSLLGLSLFGMALSFAFNKQGKRTLGFVLFGAPERNLTATDRGFFTSVWGWQLTIGMVVLLAAAGKQTQFSLIELFDADGFRSAKGLFSGLTSPDWSLLPTAIFKVIETVYIAFLATTLALPIAFLLAFFCAKNIMSSPRAFGFYAAIRTLLNIIRSVEPVIWAIIFAVWVGVGPFAGMLALMVQSIASLTKQYSEIIESVADGPIEGIRATGANTIQTVWFAIVPQVILPYISFTIYRWDINVRMATIIGFAGGGGIGTILYQYSMRAQWPEVGCLIAVIAAVVWALDLASAYLREALK